MIEGKKNSYRPSTSFLVARYTYEDEVKVDSSMENYEEKLKLFFADHGHSQETTRLILEGSAFFDVQDCDKKWIRLHVYPGDLIILPAGKIK
jgi:1,2-dihydroxy-3-keto-5-methylthiopentene dioxygenase